MKRSRAALVTLTGVGILLLWGWGGVGEAAAGPEATGVPQCTNPKGLKYTAPIGSISASGGTTSVAPDPIVQPQIAGYFGWKMAAGQSADSFRVTFTNGDSPLPNASYVSHDGGPVGAVVRPDAVCKHYDYTVTVWSGSSVATLDPGGDLVP
jgi:hypothetical protein